MENSVTESRFDLNSVLPAAYNSLLEVEKFVHSAGINKIQLELLKIRASQINGCAFCLNMHIKDAIKYGEDVKRIFVLSAWQEAPNWFN
ncbi:carboxymuconolactone decarboxylase family protein [Arcticibacter svalbardensis]|nr:carboxymuconolactone decarboxylase family protein [Arcticibacter svalbardensis]